MDSLILNKSEYIEAFTLLTKIEAAIEARDEFRLAILLTQLKYKYDLRLEVNKTLKDRLIEELGEKYVGDRALTQDELDQGYENTHTLDLTIEELS